jgi:NAD(P)-dependent dehydrogenase (short-subunit alcohol dehydrogenase family)
MSKDVVVITGACGGMGRACVATFAPRARIVAVDMDSARVAALAQEFQSAGHDVIGACHDIAAADAPAALARLAAGSGHPAALVHTAGLSSAMADPVRIMDVNLIATQRLADAFLDIATPGFSAVMVASISGHLYQPESAVIQLLSAPLAEDFWRLVSPFCPDSVAAYGLSKWGVITLCEREAARWGRKGARINSLSPGVIDTPMGRLELTSPHGPQIENLLRICPAGRWGTPEDIAGAAAYLCSEAASFVTGIDLRVDGGTTATLKQARPRP